MNLFRPAIVMILLFTALTGIAYPLALTGIAAVVFPWQANGEMISHDGRIVGSALIGQNFASPRYFQPRPSATSTPDPNDASKTIDAPYNASNSSGSNLGPTNKALIDRVSAGVDAKRAAGWTGPLPADALTTSASGLDPHISPENALLQATDVAKARGLDAEKIRALVQSHVEKPLLGVLGEQRVNVLLLNLALDDLT
jgi:potassium-transporting ATPase KdpC subunit